MAEKPIFSYIIYGNPLSNFVHLQPNHNITFNGYI